MTRRLITMVLLLWLAACSLNPLRGSGPEVLDESEYCGTASQESEAHYFATRDAFRSWIEYRSIRDFDPSLATENGVIVVEMGQRPTGGYNVELDSGEIEGDTLTLNMIWSAPRLDAAVSQALIASCVVIRPPTGNYSQVRVVDQLGNLRGEAER